MKSLNSSLALAIGALCLGGLAGIAIAVRSAQPGQARAPQRQLGTIPVLETHGVDVADWVDRGLLRLAQNELNAEPPNGAVAVDEPGAPHTSSGLVDVSAGGGEEPSSLLEQRDQLFRRLSFELGVPEVQLSALRAIVEASPYLGQGNPEVTVHPMSRLQCKLRRSQVLPVGDDQRICGSPNMVALYDPEREEPSRAKLCIDQFEFPNLPCEYPLVWVRAVEAARICRILDKRLCDAHEWEGACAGKLRPASKEYESWVNRFNSEFLHNQGRERIWATGFRPGARTCATGALKSPGCVDASWERCGTNSYPTGAFPRCVSPFGVYDLQGNVAEHMNLPLNESQLGSHGGSGETEMKGSWFAFDEYHPHPDDCRWRAPAWHATAVESESSHFNYHLGFRCCRDLD